MSGSEVARGHRRALAHRALYPNHPTPPRDIYQIAKNCRTSVEMIENYYASCIKNMLDASVINVRKAKPATESRPQPEA